MSFFSSYPSGGGGGGGSGVTSLNGLTGALTLVAGSGITITPSGSNITIAATGGGGGGITSINADTTAAQTLVTASTGTNFTISTASGVTTFAIPTASASARGLLSSTDWSTFNGKQASGSYITSLTGDVTASGPGAAASTIANGAITNAKIANATIDLTTKVTGTLPVGNGGTNSAAALSNNRVMQSSGGAIVEAAAITAARALISDANGIPTQSATTSTELGFVSGVTSSIQTQLNAKQASGSYITALTGDATASGPGSAALTLATVNTNVGSFLLANITVNAKGLVTAASAPSLTGTGNVVLANSPTLSGTVNASTLVLTTPLAATSGGTSFNTYTTGDVLYASATNTLSKLPVGSSNQVLTIVAGMPSWVSAAAPSGFVARNYLINGGFDINQKQNSTNISGGTSAYGCDQWYGLNTLDSNNSGVLHISQEAGSSTLPGSRYASGLIVATAPTGGTPQNGCELYQTIENLTTISLLDQNCSFSAQVKAQGNVNTVGLQFFYATSEIQVNTAIGPEVSVSVNTTSPTLGKVENVNLPTLTITDSGVVGVRIRILTVSTGNPWDLNNGFNVEQAMLNVGATAAPFARATNTFNEELASCQRFYFKTFAYTQQPEQAAGFLNSMDFGNFVPALTAVITVPYTLPVTMRAQPTVIMYNPLGANAQIQDGTTNSAWTGCVVNSNYTNLVNFSGTTPSGSTASNDSAVHFTADARI